MSTTSQTPLQPAQEHAEPGAWKCAAAAFRASTHVSACSFAGSPRSHSALTEEGAEARVIFQVSGGSGFEPVFSEFRARVLFTAMAHLHLQW